jgi:hypothetical protein
LRESGFNQVYTLNGRKAKNKFRGKFNLNKEEINGFQEVKPKGILKEWRRFGGRRRTDWERPDPRDASQENR